MRSRDLENNLLAGKLVVDSLERLELVVNDSRVLVVEDDLLELGATNLVSNALANNLGGENKVLKHSVVDSSKSSRDGSLLGLTVAATGLGENAALSKENNVAVRKLLLQLTGQSLLNLVDGLQSRGREEDDNSLLAARDFDFTNRLELEGSELGLEVGGRVLEVNEGLADLELELGGLFAKDLGSSRHFD